jgi:ABC-type multidrug transport system fused ATPase/permease subunit
MKYFSFLLRQHSLILALLITSIGAAMLEGMAIALVFPILQGTVNIGKASFPFPFNILAPMFADLAIGRRLQIVALLLISITAVKNLLIYSSGLFASRLQLIVIKHFRVKCIDQLMRVGMNYFNKQRASDFQIIIDGYTESTAGAIVGLIGTAVPQVFTALILMLLLFLLSWKLTLISSGLVLLASLLLGRVTRNILHASRILYEARIKFNRVVLDAIIGMKLIRLFSREKYMAQKFEGQVDSYNQARFKADQLILMVSPAFETIGIGMLAVILFIGSFLIATNSGERLGILLTFVIVISRLIMPIKTLNQVRATVMEKLPILQEVLLFLSTEKKEYMKNGTLPMAGLKQGINLNQVTFGYNPKEAIVLREVSFEIAKGTKVGIVGTSGSGKSTLTELLLRFYDPQEGRILVDGVDLREYDLGSFRKRIGVVSQDIFLFNDTIRANIAFANPAATEEEVEAAARKAYAHEFIENLPHGYGTMIGERGVLLSGGQRQRIAIARAILIDPEILIFDEATSSLDTESERFVQTALDTVGRGKTVITIAHRLSTIFDSDNIIVVEEGRVVEQGRHEDLLGLNGLYAKLVRMQDLERQIVAKEKQYATGSVPAAVES